MLPHRLLCPFRISSVQCVAYLNMFCGRRVCDVLHHGFQRPDDDVDPFKDEADEQRKISALRRCRDGTVKGQIGNHGMRAGVFGAGHLLKRAVYLPQIILRMMHCRQARCFLFKRNPELVKAPDCLTVISVNGLHAKNLGRLKKRGEGSNSLSRLYQPLISKLRDGLTQD